MITNAVACTTRRALMALSYICMTRSQRRSADEGAAHTRRALLDATVHLIETAGPAAATSRSITDRAGANLGAITYYFGSKDTLVAEALAETGRRLLHPVIDALRDTASPIEQMFRAAQLLPEILAANPAALRGYVQALAAAVHDPAVSDALAALHHDIATLLADQIRSHQAAGIAPEWVDPEAMAAVIISLVDGVAVNTAAGLAVGTAEEIGNQFAAILLHASIASPDDRPDTPTPA